MPNGSHHPLFVFTNSARARSAAAAIRRAGERKDTRTQWEKRTTIPLSRSHGGGISPVHQIPDTDLNGDGVWMQHPAVAAYQDQVAAFPSGRTTSEAVGQWESRPWNGRATPVHQPPDTNLYYDGWPQCAAVAPHQNYHFQNDHPQRYEPPPHIPSQNRPRYH